MNELINKQLCSNAAQYKCRANYKHIQRTSKTNTSKQLFVSCLRSHQAYNQTYMLIYF